MAQEFIIKSEAIEDKINQLLPSQGGFQAGVDFSASTMVIPIVDLTETATGSSLRQDLQTAQDFATQQNSITSATNTVFLNTTGFFKLVIVVTRDTSGANGTELNIFDGTTSKPIFTTNSRQGGTGTTVTTYDTVVFLRAGDSLRGTAGAYAQLQVYSRQIADLSGNITNPTGFS
jgi:hypothetical protein